MGLCVSKQPYWTDHPDNFGEKVLAIPIKQTRAEKSAGAKELNELRKEVRAQGIKVGKVRSERFSYVSYGDD